MNHLRKPYVAVAVAALPTLVAAPAQADRLDFHECSDLGGVTVCSTTVGATNTVTTPSGMTKFSANTTSTFTVTDDSTGEVLLRRDNLRYRFVIVFDENASEFVLTAGHELSLSEQSYVSGDQVITCTSRTHAVTAHGETRFVDEELQCESEPRASAGRTA